MFFTQMPKGGDLHHHYSGALYAETYVNWLDKQGWCVNKTSYQIVTDKADYQPGETVIATGTRWQPGEQVVMLFHEEPQGHADLTFATIADGDGSFVFDGYLLDESDGGVTYTITATGQESAWTAKTTFTDAPSTTTNLVSSANPSTYGTAVTFTATVTKNGSGGDPTCGTVDLKEGAATLATVTLTTNVATFSLSLSVATHSLTAVYTPASTGCTFAASTSNTVS